MKRKEMATNVIKNEIDRAEYNLDELIKHMANHFRYESDRQLTLEKIGHLNGYISGLQFALEMLEGG